MFIEKIRIKRLMTVTEFCQMLGISRQCYYNWVQGKKRMTASTRRKIEGILGEEI